VFDKNQYEVLTRCEKERNERIKFLRGLKFPSEFQILQRSAVVLFGSTTHGLCFPESDLDICVLYDDLNVPHSTYLKDRVEFMKNRKILESIVKSKRTVNCTFKRSRFGATIPPKTGKGIPKAVSNGVKFLYSFCIMGQGKFDTYRTLFFNSCNNISHLSKHFLEHKGIYNCFKELERDFKAHKIKPKVWRNCTLFLSQALKIEHLREKGRMSFLDTIEDLISHKELSDNDASALCLAMERSLRLQKKVGAKEKLIEINEEDRKLVQHVLQLYEKQLL